MTNKEAFAEYHSENPHLYELFKRFTLEKLAEGRTVLSVKGVIERIRWETDARSQVLDGYKINDRFNAHYGELFARDFPQHAGCFRTRPGRRVP